MATFTLSPPTGLTLATMYHGRNGATYTPVAGQLVVTDEEDLRAFVGRGWTVVEVAGE